MFVIRNVTSRNCVSTFTAVVGCRSST